MNGRTKAQSRIAAAETVLSHCDQADLGTRYFEATKQAAKRGDVDAQLCYLRGDFFSPEGKQIFTDAENIPERRATIHSAGRLCFRRWNAHEHRDHQQYSTAQAPARHLMC
jgi:hypothetical protein